MNTQNSQAQCSCSSAPKFVFPCSGASDVGGLSDQAARQMAKDGTGKMYCLAGIGGRVDAIMANTQAAAKLLVIDGCSQECARKTLELALVSTLAPIRDPDSTPSITDRLHGVTGTDPPARSMPPATR